MATKTTFADNKATYEAVLRGLFVGRPEDAEEYITQYFAPTFTLRDNEVTCDLAAFVKHISRMRGALPFVSLPLNVVDFVRSGNQVADRHTTARRLPDGSAALRTETFMFVKLAEDGRIDRIVETVKRY